MHDFRGGAISCGVRLRNSDDRFPGLQADPLHSSFAIQLIIQLIIQLTIQLIMQFGTALACTRIILTVCAHHKGSGFILNQDQNDSPVDSYITRDELVS